MSTEKFNQIRKKQKLQMASQFLVGVTILVVIGFFVFNSLEHDTTDKSKLGSQVQTSEVYENISTICVSDQIAPELLEILKTKSPDQVVETNGSSKQNFCDVHIARIISDSNNYQNIWKMPYVFVSRQDSEVSDISSELINNSIISNFYNEVPLIWSRDSDNLLSAKFFTETVSQYTSDQEIVSALIEDKDKIGILPLTTVTPKLKVLSVDGVKPYDEDFYIYGYELTDYVWVSNDTSESDLQLIQDSLGEWSRNSSFITTDIDTVILTGGSAVGARQYYQKLEDLPTFNPLMNISELLSKSTITHISNESIFTESCIQKDTSAILCGQPGALEWLSSVGVDVVSLTGPSILDYGRPDFEETLKQYTQGEIKYFGGGINREEAQTPAKITTENANYLFFGFSLTTPTRYLATEKASGNIAPDSSPGDGRILTDSLERFEKDESIKIVEMQWGDVSSKSISLDQSVYADIAVDKGADVVFGTTSNSPLEVQFIDKSVVFFGLGNFLKLASVETGNQSSINGVIVKLIIYSGEVITYEILPITIDQSLNISINNIDSEGEILNTVY